MSKEVAEKKSTEVSQEIDMDAFGGPAVSGSDIIIPKVLCMQKMSDAVDRDVAKVGDFIDSLTEEKLGSIEEPVKFIPFHMEKVWLVQKKVGEKFVFDRFEDVTAQNENQPWEQTIGGEEYKFQKTYNFYALLEQDPSMPYVISFRSTSAKSGRVLATQMYVKNRAQKKTPASYVMELYGDKESNDQGTFIVTKTRVSRESTQEEIKSCLEWYKTITAGEAKIHDDEGKASQGAETAEAFADDNSQF